MHREVRHRDRQDPERHETEKETEITRSTHTEYLHGYKKKK